MKELAVISTLGKITSARLETFGHKDEDWRNQVESKEALILDFDSGWKAVFVDHCGYSCCEERYMKTDDDLESIIGDHVVSFEILATEYKDEDYGDLEVSFLHLKTTSDVIVVGTYNSHNGYYGGLDLRMMLFAPNGACVFTTEALPD
jgi:hypothetical protein